jgi:hypothetical protein
MIRPMVMKVSRRTPSRPKYSLIKSVLRKTTGQGITPMLNVKGPKVKSLPPVTSPRIAFVTKNPANAR